MGVVGAGLDMCTRTPGLRPPEDEVCFQVRLHVIVGLKAVWGGGSSFTSTEKAEV